MGVLCNRHSAQRGGRRREKRKKEPGLSIDDDKLLGGREGSIWTVRSDYPMLYYYIALAKMGRKCDQGLGAAHGHCASHRYPFSHSFPFLSFPKKTLFVPFSFLYIYIFSFLLTHSRLQEGCRHQGATAANVVLFARVVLAGKPNP